ncbi:MAG: hypothetical protein LCH63_20880 [Candidatus Melainabacteria bacterium]|nr:hypothetical protein [Candidatus Melainabacteria bacterium]
MKLKAEEVEALEELLAENSSNIKVRVQLIAYYFHSCVHFSEEIDQTETSRLAQTSLLDLITKHSIHLDWLKTNNPEHSVLTKQWGQPISDQPND